jgi:hypothetical protein
MGSRRVAIHILLKKSVTVLYFVGAGLAFHPSLVEVGQCPDFGVS